MNANPHTAQPMRTLIVKRTLQVVVVVVTALAVILFFSLVFFPITAGGRCDGNPPCARVTPDPSDHYSWPGD